MRRIVHGLVKQRRKMTNWGSDDDIRKIAHFGKQDNLAAAAAQKPVDCQAQNDCSADA